MCVLLGRLQVSGQGVIAAVRTCLARELPSGLACPQEVRPCRMPYLSGQLGQRLNAFDCTPNAK